MRFVRQYFVPRLIQYGLVTWLGLTVIFFIPRIGPVEPVERMIAEMRARGGRLDPAATKEMVRILREMYGLEEGLLTQYVSFWRRLFTGDFGPSLSAFPTPVIEIIGRALPWTLGLLLVSTVSAWIIGNITGGLVGYFRRGRALKILDGMVMFIRPIPHYIFGFLLLVFFAYLLPVFPLGGGYTIGMRIAFTWPFVMDALNHAFLPAVSMMLLGMAWHHQTMRLLVQNIKEEDHVRYAKMGSVKEGTIFGRYVMRNALLPQITALTMSLGMIFSGALIVEIVFAYPGIGSLLFQAILVSDYNLIMGIMTISIVAISTSILFIDFLYPLVDPRIRLK